MVNLALFFWKFQFCFQKTSKERDTFEEEYIRFHIAQKREVDFPKNMQNEVDTMARNVRNENIALIARLKVSLSNAVKHK